MSEPIAQRTLVKSPPELWAEISDVEALARHLGAFGEIRITRLVPETAVSWEGEIARGTVELSASGWGTKVTLTATSTAPTAPEAPAAPAAPAPINRKPPAAPADEPHWAASVEQKVRDRYVGAPTTTHLGDARESAHDEPRSEPAKPATTEASTVAATPATGEASTVAAAPAVASLPETDADADPPAKARPPRGLLARLKYWFTPPEDAGAKVTPAAVADGTTPTAVPGETTPSNAPDGTASGTPERATSAAAAHTPSVTKPHTATPARLEPCEADEPPRLQGGEPAERQDAAATEATPPEAHAEASGTAVDEGTIVGILTGVLDELGSAHHRPFSRG